MKKPDTDHSSQTDSDLSFQQQRQELLQKLQVEMAQHHQTKRRSRALRSGAMLLTGVSVLLFFVFQSFFKPGQTGTDDLADQSKRQLVHHQLAINADSGKADVDPSRSMDSKSLNPERSPGFEKYLVSNVDLKARELEEVDDQEMLRLLENVGIKGWIAEIDGVQVVITEDGRRL